MKQPEWFYTSIVYSLDVRSFKDSDSDGLGDIRGLTDQLGYLVELGVDCIWLAPFFKSREYDDGYDVADYYHIDPSLGSMEDFSVLVDKARSLGIRIVLDLVVNHTSIHHPWFKRAIEEPDSIYYDYYIWKKQKPENDDKDVMFPTVEDSNWKYEPAVGAYYYHTFYHHQPDLNIVNPMVQREIVRIIDFWMGTGIAGFRIDAVPQVLHNKGGSRFEGDPYDLLNEWRDAVMAHDEQAILFGEANVDPKTYREFLKEGRLAALFNFYTNSYTFLSLAQQRAAPLEKALTNLPLTGSEHYLNFLRNHDELDLGILNYEDRQAVYDAFAPLESMRLYERGIRRRMPPMMNNDPNRIKMAMSLLLTLPGTPVIRYGEEIGMGDDLNLPERRSVRTAMQWSAARNAGFSDTTPQALRYPLVRVGEFGYEKVNVEAQLAEKGSLLNEVKRMIHTRKDWIDWFGYGRFELLSADQDPILCYAYVRDRAWLIVVHNLSGKIVTTQIRSPLSDNAKLTILSSPEALEQDGADLRVRLGRYGYGWFSLSER